MNPTPEEKCSHEWGNKWIQPTKPSELCGRLIPICTKCGIEKSEARVDFGRETTDLMTQLHERNLRWIEEFGLINKFLSAAFEKGREAR